MVHIISKAYNNTKSGDGITTTLRYWWLSPILFRGADETSDFCSAKASAKSLHVLEP